MASEKWEKHKKKVNKKYITQDEVLAVLIGIIIFIKFPILRISYIIAVIIWYWIKIRVSESKIISKKAEIYNTYYDLIEPVAQSVIDGRYNQAKKPLMFDLEILESERKFLVDKFAVINLIILILIQLSFLNNKH